MSVCVSCGLPEQPPSQLTPTTPHTFRVVCVVVTAPRLCDVATGVGPVLDNPPPCAILYLPPFHYLSHTRTATVVLWTQLRFLLSSSVAAARSVSCVITPSRRF